MRSRIVGLVLLAMVLGGPASGEDEARRAATERAGHVARAVGRLYIATEQLDLEPAIAFLYDEDWLVRRYALVRLRATGLPPELYGALLVHAAPGGPGIDDEASELLDRVAVWAEEEFDEEPLADEIEVSGLDAAIGPMGILRELLGRPLPAAEARLLVDLATALVEGLDEADRRIAGEMLLAHHGTEARRELDVEPGALEAEDVVALCDWYWTNRSYLYHHARARGLRVDLAARDAGTPTDEYRAEHPWPAGEGPEAPYEGEPEGGRIR